MPASSRRDGSRSPCSPIASIAGLQIAGPDLTGQEHGDHGLERLEALEAVGGGSVRMRPRPRESRGGLRRGSAWCRSGFAGASIRLRPESGSDETPVPRRSRHARVDVPRSPCGSGLGRLADFACWALAIAALYSRASRLLRRAAVLGCRTRRAPALSILAAACLKSAAAFSRSLRRDLLQRPLHQGLDDLLGDPIVHAALGALPHALGRGG